MVTLDPDLEQAQQGGRVSLHVVGSYIRNWFDFRVVEEKAIFLSGLQEMVAVTMTTVTAMVT
jgi:hypothetical protein